MPYKVSFYLERSTFKTKFYLSQSQAIHGMKKFAYAKLEAFGALDTVAAHNVMDAIAACDDIMPAQSERRVVIGNTGYEMILSNTKRYNT